MTDLTQFLVDASGLDGVSVSLEDDGRRAVATVHSANASDIIDASAVHETAREHGLVVAGSRTDFAADVHVVEVTAGE